MVEQVINFETAKLAKEKGFKSLTFQYYKPDGEKLGLKEYSTEFAKFCTPIHSQTLIQKWLREVHNIAVLVSFNDNTKVEYFYFIHTNVLKPYSNRICSLPFKTDSYEEALEVGLQEALKLIENGKL